MNEDTINSSVWTNDLDDELTTLILPSTTHSSRKVFVDYSIADQNKLETMNYELIAVTKKIDAYLELLLKQADTIKDLRSLVKARDDQILDLQNKLAEESNI